MKTKTTIIIFFTLLSIKAMTQGFEWVKKLQSDQSGELRCVIITNDQHYLASGKLNKAGYLMETDTSGAVIWDKSFLYLGEIFQIKQTYDGGFAFYATDTSSSGCVFVKTDAAGDTLWTKKIAAGVPRNNKCFLQTTDNGYVMAYSKTDTLHLRRLSPTGDFLWSKYFSGLHKATANSVCQTSDGGFLVGGNTSDSLPGNAQQDMYIIKTNTNGDTLWTHVIQIHGFQELMGAVETVDNNYALLYYNGNGCVLTSFIRKINAADSVIWDNPIMTGSYSAFPWSLCNTKDHGFIVAGEMQHLVEGTTYDFTVSKIDSMGVEKWFLNFCGPDYDYAFSAVQESDSVYIASGYSCNGGNDNKLTLAKVSSNLNTSITTELSDNELFSVFPNPTYGCFTLIAPPTTRQILILNSSGQMVQNEFVDRQTNFSFSLHNNGLYLVQIITDKQTVTKKIMMTN